VSAVAMDIDVIPMGAMTTTWRDEGWTPMEVGCMCAR
jgi:hypothetical protein